MKKVKYSLILIITILMLSGCVKAHSTMSIDKDKSMVYETEILFSDELGEEVSREFKATDYESRDFKITTVKESSYSGYKISKKFQNIDDLSNNNGEEVIISDFMEKDFNSSNLFKLKNGFFKDTYTAKFKYKVDTEKYNSDNNTETEVTDSANITSQVQSDYLNLSGEMEFTYVVNLPYKANSNNATSIEDSGKTLIWELSSDSESSIEYSFNIYNVSHIIIIIVIGVIVLIAVIVVLIIVSKKKSSKETLIHKDFDPSIANKINETKSESPLEYTLPHENTESQMEIVDKGPQFVVPQTTQVANDVPQVQPVNNYQYTQVQNVMPSQYTGVSTDPTYTTNQYVNGNTQQGYTTNPYAGQYVNQGYPQQSYSQQNYANAQYGMQHNTVQAYAPQQYSSGVNNTYVQAQATYYNQQQNENTTNNQM